MNNSKYKTGAIRIAVTTSTSKRDDSNKVADKNKDPPIMLDTNCTIEERWEAVNKIINGWLQERQDMIVQYCAISGANAFAPDSTNSVNRLKKFCQILVDYVSAGHFEIYYQLLREAEEFNDGSAELAKSLYPHLVVSMDAALEFNDKYADAKGDLSSLPASLSKLGQTLESRFEIEDQLVTVMHNAHREQVVT